MKTCRTISMLAALALAALEALPCAAQHCKGYVMVDCRIRNKAHPELETWTQMPSRVLDSLDFGPLAADEVNRYGSLVGEYAFPATGYFHTARHDGRWIMVDPEGRMHIDAKVVSVSMPRSAGKESWRAFRRLFGSREAWMRKTGDMLLEHGFDGLGNWSDCKAAAEYDAGADGQVLSYYASFNVMAGYGKSRGITHQEAGHTGYPQGCIPVFDPEFEPYCDSVVAQAVKPYLGDPCVVGYFSDNELPFGKANLESYLSLPTDDCGRQEAEAWIAERGVSRGQIDDSLRMAFAGHVAERYLSIVRAALRRHDPDHMYMGPRLHGGAKYIREVYQAAGRHCDVIAVNYYGAWEVKASDIERWESWTDTPFVVTEFYTKGEDSGMGNTSGAGWRVRTQDDRGIHYENFVIGLLESRSCVGWHWFKYRDNDPTDRHADPSNTDANKGIVDACYGPYEALLKHMKHVNEVRYALMLKFNS